MNLLFVIGSLFAGQWVLNQVYNIVEKNTVSLRAREYADSLGLPVLDFGCGIDPRGDYNVDITHRPVASNFTLIQSFEKSYLPFPDKFFGSALCFHVLEHVNDPQHTLDELSRVAERVFVITPHPFFWRTWIHGGHKWIFINGVCYRNPLHSTIEELNDIPILYPE